MSRFFIALDPKIHEKAKALFTLQCPVVHKGIEYLRIKSLRYTIHDGKATQVYLELLDKNKNCIVNACAEQVVKENPGIIKEDKEKEY